MAQKIIISQGRSGKYFVIIVFVGLLAYLLLSGKKRQQPQPAVAEDVKENAEDTKINPEKKGKRKKPLGLDIPEEQPFTPVSPITPGTAEISVTPVTPFTATTPAKTQDSFTISGESGDVELYELPTDNVYRFQRPEETAPLALKDLPPSKAQSLNQPKTLKGGSDTLGGKEYKEKKGVNFVDQTGSAPDV